MSRPLLTVLIMMTYTQHTLNPTPKSQPLATEPVTYNGTELMAMSKELVCKNTKAKVKAEDVAYVKESAGEPGQMWKYSAKAAAIAGCGAVVFDPRMVPMGSGRIIGAGGGAGGGGAGGGTNDKNGASVSQSAGVTVRHSVLLTMVVLVAAMIW